VHEQLRTRASHLLERVPVAQEWAPVRDSLQAIALSSGPDDSVRIAAGIWSTANSTIEALRPESTADAHPEPLLDWLQYNLIGLRTLAGSHNSEFGILVEKTSAVSWALDAVVGVQALAVEKFGVAPPTVVSGIPSAPYGSPIDVAQALAVADTTKATAKGSPSLGLVSVGVRAYISFATTELLKNAYKAVITRYGAQAVDDAPPVHIRFSEDAVHALIAIEDAGGGVPQRKPGGHVLQSRRHVGAITQFSYFNSTAHAGAGEPTYQYSRDFGVPFAGKGLGLVRTRLYARYHGGSLTLLSQPGYGTTALMALEKSGTVSSDFSEHPP